MIDHDKVVGQLLGLLDKMGLKDNTLVQYSTDNGPHMNTWPDAGARGRRASLRTGRPACSGARFLACSPARGAAPSPGHCLPPALSDPLNPYPHQPPPPGMTPFRCEKNSCWEGAYRVPELVRWPGKL